MEYYITVYSFPVMQRWSTILLYIIFPGCSDGVLYYCIFVSQDAVVEYLLPMSNLQSIEDGLLHAISRDNVRMCDLFLDHPLYKKNRIQLSSSDGFYQKVRCVSFILLIHVKLFVISYCSSQHPCQIVSMHMSIYPSGYRASDAKSKRLG